MNQLVLLTNGDLHWMAATGAQFGVEQLRGNPELYCFEQRVAEVVILKTLDAHQVLFKAVDAEWSTADLGIFRMCQTAAITG